MKKEMNIMAPLQNLNVVQLCATYLDLNTLIEALDTCFDMEDLGYCDRFTMESYEKLVDMKVLEVYGYFLKSRKLTDPNWVKLNRYNLDDLEGDSIEFEVPKQWLMNYIEEHFCGVGLDEWLSSYTWDHGTMVYEAFNTYFEIVS